MTRSSEEKLLYALAGYLAVSLFSTVLLLLAALAGMKLFFVLARAALGPREVYWLKPLIYDSCGFAIASGGAALTHYYLVSLLKVTGAGRAWLCGTVFFAAVFCGLFFWRGAAHSSLGAYGFSGLSIMVSVLLGGTAAVFQKPWENPWPEAVSSLFR